MSHSATILGCEGLALTRAERAFFAEARPWGFILFARNIEDAAQVSDLTSELRDCVGHDAPILIDQEGGRVQRMRGPIWREWMPPLDQVKRGGARSMALRYRLIAHELRAVGIDVNCAPTADVARSDTHPFLRNRLYGSDVETVVDVARAVSEGLMAGGVLPVLKHIPGHGAALTDSHKGLPRVAEDRATLTDVDFAAFRALNTLPLGMTAHIVFEALGSQLPATMDREMITLIRDEIGFRGALMTDDLSMGALPGPIGERAARAKAAGCDLILHCNGDLAEMHDVVIAAGALDGLSQQRCDAALAQRKTPDPLDIEAIEQDLSDLLGGEVYV
ncbi:glycoside hydrolase family 3 N-terminal domain-containing protein [Gymnodinialimonas ceratoperidinii]|uniref:Beta-hexosaminidase n=1 Tax=Gymnodinialimonas ceratoperidinii TaxID=2856823 RepID=A0A8F6TW29_9RHOB|nr:glycoside hydrolase family 3 N-terminal domain-containing protein [Gymnodinialimonas ceratoperidinii]QXT38969.1 beta-hexosaminidase [Gymnodinialimonas ceratoperidinii]